MPSPLPFHFFLPNLVKPISTSLSALPALVILLVVSFLSSGLVRAQEPSPEKSLVRVNATLQSYNFVRPWEKGAPTPRRGLGAVLANNQVLVTAELIVNSTYIELEHPSTGDKVPARCGF